jgi:sugar phosphate isomerase/epimerase
MDRRDFTKTLGALLASPQIQAQPQAVPHCRLRSGLVAYSFNKQLAAKTLTYESLIEYAAGLGVDGLDTTVYWFPDTSDRYLASLRHVAYRNALSLYSIAVRVRLSQPTPELQRAEFETLKQWVDVAEKVGATHIRVFGGPIPKDATEAQAIAWAVEVLKRCADYAGSRGMILGVEDDGGLTTTAEQTVEIVSRANSPWAGITLDTSNFRKNGYSQVAMCLPYTVNVHFKEMIATEDGTKEKADWNRLVGMFAQSGYKGYLSLEHDTTEPADVAVPRLIPELKRTIRKYSA